MTNCAPHCSASHNSPLPTLPLQVRKIQSGFLLGAMSDEAHSVNNCSPDCLALRTSYRIRIPER